MREGRAIRPACVQSRHGGGGGANNESQSAQRVNGISWTQERDGAQTLRQSCIVDVHGMVGKHSVCGKVYQEWHVCALCT